MILSDGAHHTNATYYSDVRVPADMLVGEENGGWRLITTQLNHERVMLGPAGRSPRSTTSVHAWASKPGGNGDTARPRRRQAPARRDQGHRGGSTNCSTGKSRASGENIDVADAAATKVFGTERHPVRRPAARRRSSAQYGNPAEPDTAELLEWLDSQTKRNLVITFGGGVNEVMREMIAASGLKVPRVAGR